MPSSVGLTTSVDQLQQKPDPGLELLAGALKCRVRVLVGLALLGGIGDAPVDEVRMLGELGTDLPDAVTQADDVTEVVGGELLLKGSPRGSARDASILRVPKVRAPR